jgi:hypothetical protein
MFAFVEMVHRVDRYVEHLHFFLRVVRREYSKLEDSEDVPFWDKPPSEHLDEKEEDLAEEDFKTRNSMFIEGLD